LTVVQFMPAPLVLLDDDHIACAPPGPKDLSLNP